jgi:hypothetical protein
MGLCIGVYSAAAALCRLWAAPRSAPRCCPGQPQRAFCVLTCRRKAQQNYGSARVGMFMRRGEQTRRGVSLVDLCPRTQTYDVRSRPSGTGRTKIIPFRKLVSDPAPTRCQCTQHLTLLCRSPRAEGYDSRAGEQRERRADAGDARGGSSIRGSRCQSPSRRPFVACSVRPLRVVLQEEGGQELDRVGRTAKRWNTGWGERSLE